MIDFREIIQIEGREFADAMDIYVNHFPANERHPVTLIGERVLRGLNKLYVGVVEDQVVFLALLWPLTNTKFVLLDYVATKDSHRRKGFASAFIMKVRDELKTDHKYLILEVEDPRFGTNREEKEKRVSFYRRLGAKELEDVRYVLPPLDGSTPTEMILMVFSEYGEKKMNGSLIRQIITKMYRELYGRDERDVLLGTVVNQIGETVKVI